MALEGVLIVDKPAGITSHDVVNRVRRLAGLRRIGHAGTLDPLATGVLLLCLGRATRLVEYLVGQTKAYMAVLRLGQSTATYDAEGDVVAERPFAHVTPALVEEALAHFRGSIQQRPPAYSAIKQAGQPLYKLARQGVPVERPLRSVTISALQMTCWNPPFVQLALACSSGTYVRSLAHDLGEVLGCGAHLTALRRTAVGSFTLADAVPLDALTPQNLPEYVRPPETAVAHLPILSLSASDARALQMGQCVPRQPTHPPHPLARIHSPDDAFIGIAAAREDQWQAEKILKQL